MHVAIQTISWGARVIDVGQMLREIKEAGYTGVEFFQHPDELGPVDGLYHTLNGLGLRCIGIAGGSLQEKIDFVRKYIWAERASMISSSLASRDGPRWQLYSGSENQPYIYLDNWEGKAAEDAMRIGMTLALHPHMFRQIQTTAEVDNYLSKHAGLRFLPDTAHLTIAGEDIKTVIDQHYGRIEAIHLKDWTAEYGRAYQFYGRGFVELGQGDVAIGSVIKYLKQRNYRKWIVVGQGATWDPLRSASRSRQWLRHQGI
jgi:sugar phosphate isomerase/epimerase